MVVPRSRLPASNPLQLLPVINHPLTLQRRLLHPATTLELLLDHKDCYVPAIFIRQVRYSFHLRRRGHNHHAGMFARETQPSTCAAD